MKPSHLRTLLIGAGFALFLGGCSTPGKFSPEKPVQEIPYIIIYGRENCSACKTFKRRLDDAQVGYTYKDITDENAQNEMYSRMEKAGLNVQKFLIPVIDVNGSLAIRPSLRDVLDHYGHLPSEVHPMTAKASASDCGEAGADLSSCSEQRQPVPGQ